MVLHCNHEIYKHLTDILNRLNEYNNSNFKFQLRYNKTLVGESRYLQLGCGGKGDVAGSADQLTNCYLRPPVRGVEADGSQVDASHHYTPDSRGLIER